MSEELEHKHEHHHEHGHEHHHEHEHNHEHGHEEGSGTVKKLLISAVLFIAAIITQHFIKTSWSGTVSMVLYIIAYLTVGFDVLKGAWENIRTGEVFGEEFLMAVASLGALIIGQYAEAVAVMFLYCLGEYLQDLAVDKSRDSIAELMDIRPDYANIENADGTETKADPDDVKVGDIILIKPGEKIPLDGDVIEGDSLIDTASLTGEPVPRSVHPGDSVISGCINVTGLIRVRVTKEFKESTASRILELVEHASERKSSSENFITKFARIYTPAVCIAALVIAILPPLILHQPFADWIYRALTFLVVSCPCALVISVPLSFFAGIGAASGEGILVKGSNYLEALANTKTAVFDKTGTLTEGSFEVRKINLDPATSLQGQDLLELAAHAESNSSHPIALSIIRAYTGSIDRSRITQVEELAGHGIRAVVDGKEIHVCNGNGLAYAGIAYEPVEEPGTIVYVASDGHCIGSLVISDRIKADSEKAFKEIKACGVRKTVMLTGDSKSAATEIASKLGIDEVYSELLPADKVNVVEKLLTELSENEKLVFAGDGVNDAPVLARADIGIAMGALGSDAAIEAADVVFMDDKPSKLATAIKLARRTISIARQNIIFAIAVKVIVLILSAFGKTTMWAAVFADVGVALICIISSLRNMKKID